MAKECEVTSKTYKEIRVLPAALKSSGDVEQFSKTLGFYITDTLRTALGVHIPNKEATLIINAESVTVTKKSAEVWAAGEPIFWLSGTTEFTNVDDGSGLLVGKAKMVAATGDATGEIVFKDYYPVQRGHQVGSAQIPYKIATAFPDPIFSLYATSALITGSIDAAKIDLVLTVAAVSHYVKGLRATVNSNVKTGASCRALYGKLDYKTNGYANGMAAAIGADLTFRSAASCPRGEYYVYEAQLNGGGSGQHTSCYISFMGFKVGTTMVAHMDGEYGFLFDISGVSEGNGKLCDNGGSPAEADGGIRCRINGATRYLLYANDAET